jgi:hypothetical protein
MRKCKRVILRWFVDPGVPIRHSDNGWVIGFDVGRKEILWQPPLPRDYMRGKHISTNSRRALVRRAAREYCIDLTHGFKLEVDLTPWEGV